MKLSWKREMFPIAVLVAMAVAGVYYYHLLPHVMPTHFDIRGKPNGWMVKPVFFLYVTVLVLFLYLLLTFLPLIDPLRRKIEPKFNIVLLLRDVILVFIAATYLLTIEAARAGALRVRFLGIVLGLLVVVLGNYMPKIPQNWFIGIRTPWTISSEVIWKKTHILGGWLFALSGLLYIFWDALNLNQSVPLVGVLAAAGISVLYSFYLYKRPERASRP